PVAEVYATLIGQVGLPVSAEHVYERFGIPKPESGQAILVPPTASMLPMKTPAPAAPPAPGPSAIRAILADSPPNPRQAQRAVDAMATAATQAGADVIGATLEPLLQV